MINLDLTSRRGRSRSTERIALFALVMTFGAAAYAGPLPEQFTLSGYVPEDAWLYLHTAKNRELAWLDKEWAEVFEALEASGVGHDLAGMVVGLLDEEQAAKVDELAKLFKNVRWGELVSREFVYSQRAAKVLGGYDYFILARGEPGTGEANMEALVALFRGLAALGDGVEFVEGKKHGIETWSIRSRAKDSGVTVSDLDFFRKGDVIGLTSGSASLAEVLALVAGKGKKRSIAEAPRFREAIAQVQAPEEYVSFVDVKLLLSDLKALAVPCCKKGAGANCAYCKNRAAFRKGVDLLNVIDYAVTTVETDGQRQRSHGVVRLQKEKVKCSVASCGLNRKPFNRFDRFVPANALGFSLSDTFDLEVAYGLLTEFIAKDLPGGDGAIAKWNGLLASIGFDPQRDFFSWWSGEMISVTVPPAVVTPMSGADSVLMIRVKDAALAQAKIDALLNRIAKALQAQGQMLAVAPADVRAEGFKQVMHPWFAMIMRPVIGVHDEWLVVGTSGAAIDRCLDVAAGKAPSIVENDRFKKEGLMPEGPVRAASFTDTSRFGEELSGAIAMTGMFGGLVPTMLKGEELAGVRSALQKLIQVVGKLGPVVSKLDFFSSESSVTTYDGNRTFRTERVVTYKPLRPKKVRSTDSR